MRTHLLLVGVALIAGLAFWWLRDEPAQAPPQGEPGATPQAEGGVEAAQADPIERRTVEASDTLAPVPATPPDRAPTPTNVSQTVAVDPWLVRLRVVDESDKQVADATVTLWAARRATPEAATKEPGPSGNWYSGRVEPALLELHTDADGRAQTTLAVEFVYAEARKDGLGLSGQQRLWNTRAAGHEVVLRLEATLTLRGIVFRADGTPASGARVTAKVTNLIGGARARQTVTPAPASAGTDGRFALTVQRQSGYQLQAELDGTKSLPDFVWVMAEPVEVTLLFPGGITLSGVVVDADGQPVAHATVKSWRELPAQPMSFAKGGASDSEQGVATTGDDGRFSIAVRKHARYQLVASRDSHATSKPLWVETTAVRPHVDARLALLSFATIRGRVEHSDGSPFAGASVSASAEAGDVTFRADMPNRYDLFPHADDATTGADGAFALVVHPGTTWTVTARGAATMRQRAKQTGVAPGSEGVVLLLADPDPDACVVHGTVVRDDGERVGVYQVELLAFEGGKPIAAEQAGADIDGDRFTVSALPRGKQFALRVSLPRGPGNPAAPAEVGPFATDQKELRFEFRLPPWGEVPVRVFDASGAPAQNARVSIAPAVALSDHGGVWPVGTDGCVVMKRMLPGAGTLRVSRDAETLWEQAVFVAPGLNAEVVVHLPAK